MRILMTADTVGGVWTYAIELAQALTGRGTQVALATMGAPLSVAQHRQADGLKNVIVHESDYRLEWMHEPWDDVSAAGRWLLDIERSFRPNIVHLNGYAHGQLPFISPTLVVGHSCVLSWYEAVRGEPAPAEWDRYRREVTAGLRGADMVVAPSRAMLAALDRHYGPIRSGRVIYNARSPHPSNTPVKKEEIIFSAGRLWDQAKNLAALEAVAPRLPWPVYIAGDQRHPDGGGVEARGLVMLGQVDEEAIATWQARTAIFASPARYEPFGLAALEAALAGCALVLGDIPSLREVWDDAATYVPPDSTDALESALMMLIRRPSLRREMASRARARAERYSPTTMVGQYLSAYRSLLRSADHAAHRDEIPSGNSRIAAMEGP